MSQRVNCETWSNRMITVKLYLKSKRRPITLEFNAQTTYEKYVEALKTQSIISVGSFAFSASEFRYQIAFQKK